MKAKTKDFLVIFLCTSFLLKRHFKDFTLRYEPNKFRHPMFLIQKNDEIICKIINIFIFIQFRILIIGSPTCWPAMNNALTA
jgi:hypothetical protein